jgi:hypothetical protein
VNPERGRVAFLSHLPTLSISGRKVAFGKVPPTGGWLAPKFSVHEQLDSAWAVCRHHPRCRDYE